MSSQGESLSTSRVEIPDSNEALNDSPLASDTAKMLPPRPPFLEFLLHFLTFGIYSSFWFVGRARDLNRLGDNKLKPFWWFFVPLVALAQLFAVPKFINQLKLVESKYDLPQWSGWKGCWLLVLFLLTVFFNITSKFEVPFWSIYLALVLWAGIFTALQLRFNAIKRASGVTRWKKTYKGYTGPEWFVLSPLLLVSLLLQYLLILQPLLVNEIRTYSPGSRYTASDQEYSFTIEGKDWIQIEVGNYSDGSAEAEFSGPVSGSYFIVFKHSKDTKLGDVSRFRINAATDELTGSKCKETRRFADKKLSVVSTTICEGRILGDPAIHVSSVIETKDSVYELYGEMTSATYTYESNVSAMKRMAKGFQPL